jgi:hypothetical protein
MFPAVVVVNMPVGISVICAPPVAVRSGAAMFTTAVVPEIKVTGALMMIEVALATVGATLAKDMAGRRS